MGRRFRCTACGTTFTAMRKRDVHKLSCQAVQARARQKQRKNDARLQKSQQQRKRKLSQRESSQEVPVTASSSPLPNDSRGGVRNKVSRLSAGGSKPNDKSREVRGDASSEFATPRHNAAPSTGQLGKCIVLQQQKYYSMPSLHHDFDDVDCPSVCTRVESGAGRVARTANTSTKSDTWPNLANHCYCVCNEAARRHALRHDPNAKKYATPVHLPYIKKRLCAGDDDGPEGAAILEDPAVSVRNGDKCEKGLNGTITNKRGTSATDDAFPELKEHIFGFVVRPKSQSEMTGGRSHQTRTRQKAVVKSGSQLDHKHEPAPIQGFIAASTFVVLASTFRWDSVVPWAGITAQARIRRPQQVDVSGFLASELQRTRCTVVRYADGAELDSPTPSEGATHPASGVGQEPKRDRKYYRGQKWDRIAEVLLMGALGCGHQLMMRMLRDLQEKGYRFAVVNSIATAIPFYERFGFVRVGAVLRCFDDPAMPEVAFSDAGDTDTSHVSYMMARPLFLQQNRIGPGARVALVVPPRRLIVQRAAGGNGNVPDTRTKGQQNLSGTVVRVVRPKRCGSQQFGSSEPLRAMVLVDPPSSSAAGQTCVIGQQVLAERHARGNLMAKKAWIPRPDLCPWAIRSKSVVRKLSVTGLTESRLRMCEAYSLFEIKHSSGSSSRGSAEHSSEEPGHSLRQKAQKSGDCNLKAPSDSHAAQAHQPDARMPMHPRSWLLNQSSEAVLARAELSDTLAILAALCQFLSDPTRNGRPRTPSLNCLRKLLRLALTHLAQDLIVFGLGSTRVAKMRDLLQSACARATPRRSVLASKLQTFQAVLQELKSRLCNEESYVLAGDAVSATKMPIRSETVNLRSSGLHPSSPSSPAGGRCYSPLVRGRSESFGMVSSEDMAFLRNWEDHEAVAVTVDGLKPAADNRIRFVEKGKLAAFLRENPTYGIYRLTAAERQAKFLMRKWASVWKALKKRGWTHRHPRGLETGPGRYMKPGIKPSVCTDETLGHTWFNCSIKLVDWIVKEKPDIVKEVMKGARS